ncbi:MAG: biotin/lipoyl-binding protein, partial [Armatimonadota bacterium]|nr:biotin/lipoyl-binding protein [Armatimonadota bacterium]
MADEQQQRTQSQTYPAPAKDGNESAHGNGHGQAKFPATTPEGHDGGKYAAKETPTGDTAKDEKKPAGPVKKLIIGAIVAAILVVGLIWGLNIYHYNQNHEATDDAQVTGNQINISPIISGTLNQLLVDEGSTVKKGQIIGRLEDSGPRAAVAQAQASYQAALSQLPQAEQNLIYQQQATDAGIRKAQSELAAQQAKTTGAQQQVILSRNQVLNQVRQAQSQVEQAQEQAEQFDAQVQTARAAVNSQQQTVRTAQRAADAADATIRGAQANAQKTANDEVRYAKLVQQEAVTPQQNDAAVAAAASAQSQLDATRYQASQAHSQINTVRANVA